MHSMMTRSLALTAAFCVFSLIGCATALTTIPQDYALGAKDESVVFGRVWLDLEKPPLAFFANLNRMTLTVRNDATGKDYVLVCDKTGLDSAFYVSLPPGPYRYISVRTGDLSGPLPGRFDLGAAQVQYLGTLRFRGVSLLSLSRQWESSHFFDKFMDRLIDATGMTTSSEKWYIIDESEQAQKSFREKYPRISQPVVKSAMIAGTPMTVAASAQIVPPNRVVSERLIGKFHPSGIPASLKISLDSKRVAYVVVNRGIFAGNKFFVVVDGKEEKQYDDIYSGGPIFSPDSTRVAYGARVGNKWFVVVDGKEQKQYDGILKDSLIFSPDSQRLAYAAGVGNERFVVIDGKEEKPYDATAEGLIFSPDSQRVAYAARARSKWLVVVNGKEEKTYDGIGRGTPIFSPDSKRVAYRAQEGNKRVLVVDGKEEKQYDDIAEGTPIFSPDSRRLAFTAKVGNQWLVVVDGKEEKRYDGIGAGSLIFSPDSKRLAYGARLGNKWFMVVDGKEEKQVDSIGTVSFSPDSQRVAYGAVVGKKSLVVADGKEGTEYDAVISGGRSSGGRIVFDRPDIFHYLVVKGSELYLVEEKIE